ncbi:allergen asp f4-like protein [Ophiostoma piceae UAMH 11346]|uniref:Allergen asp f4-like protein n=1 Tax=Ophiostoma piceae (strain UAMH 11346) TaxID=1262450 RepID=S3C6J4_OPHP1|nr:allergen asp f4-like protein [Ophiostoma piceae UAMH 11346]
MRVSTAMILAAVGVSALPSGHNHNHARLHREAAKRDEDVLVTATIDGKVVSWTQGGSPFKAAHKPTAAVVEAAAVTSSTVAAATTTSSSSSSTYVAPTTTSSSSVAAATTTSSSAAATSTSSSSGGSGSGISTYEAFTSCSSNTKRATMADITYVGNTGCDGYGSNIKLIQSNLASDYDYVVEAVNDGSSAMQCKVWNKIGSDGGINGFFSGNEVDSFTLAAGSSQYLAFDKNSQGGMCCATGSIALTSYGEFNCPWLEYDFGSTKNSDYSGFDASALVEGSSGPWAALKVCTADSSTCSTLNGDGTGTNAYLPGDEALDGIGGNLSPGKVTLISTWS